MRHMRYGKGTVLALALLFVSLFHPALSRAETGSLFSVPPLACKPTATSVTLSLAAGNETLKCYARFRNEAAPDGKWDRTTEVIVPAGGTAELVIGPLQPDRQYRYEVYAIGRDGRESPAAAEGIFRTRRSSGPFSFVLFSDSHLTPSNPERAQVLRSVTRSASARKPDFAMMLGDNIQTFTSHGGPLGEKQQGMLLYRLLRHGLAELAPHMPVFTVNGNWEGENGWHLPERRQWAEEARKAYLPGPGDRTYPEGGSPGQDYYAFTWGNALFVVLNVTGYTRIDHAHTTGVGKADDWTLGDDQKGWLKKTLAASKERWKFIAIHHTVGGNAGNDVNSRYGRGGGRAAKVGEQAVIHDWMKQYGVQALFYGHDHIFTDIVADGIHYVCVGSAGAPWKFDRSETGCDRYWIESGYTLVEVGTDAARFSFVKPDPGAREGSILHSFVVR